MRCRANPKNRCSSTHLIHIPTNWRVIRKLAKRNNHFICTPCLLAKLSNLKSFTDCSDKNKHSIALTTISQERSSWLSWQDLQEKTIQKSRVAQKWSRQGTWMGWEVEMPKTPKRAVSTTNSSSWLSLIKKDHAIRALSVMVWDMEKASSSIKTEECMKETGSTTRWTATAYCTINLAMSHTPATGNKTCLMAMANWTTKRRNPFPSHLTSETWVVLVSSGHPMKDSFGMTWSREWVSWHCPMGNILRAISSRIAYRVQECTTVRMATP